MLKLLIQRPSAAILVVLTAIAYLTNSHVSDRLMEHYIASQFPVPYFEAQLSFSAGKLKGWYAFLLENNTMEQYIFTQIYDFLFMLSVLILHASALLMVSRLFPLTSRWRRAMVYCAIISALAPLADALENGISFIMLADPSGFANWLALVYSSFATVKFAMFTFAYLSVVTGVLAAVALKLHYLWTKYAPA